MLWIATAVIAVTCVAMWGRMIYRGEPWLYGARRCLRERQRPGEQRFLARLLFKPALICQTTGSDGKVNRVVVQIPGFGRSTLLQTLAPLAKSPDAWPNKDGRYEIDCSSSYEHYPGLENIRTWAEYHSDCGVHFVAERTNKLMAIPADKRAAHAKEGRQPS